MKTRRIGVAAIAVSLLVAATTAAVGQNQRRERFGSREDVEGMMEAYVLSKLQDALELTDEQFGRMVVAQKKLSDTRREYRRDRMRILQDMRRSLERDDAGEDELQTLLAELDALKVSFAAAEENRYQAIDAILDVRQRARYRIMEVELQRRLGEMLREVRGSRNQRDDPDW